MGAEAVTTKGIVVLDRRGGTGGHTMAARALGGAVDGADHPAGRCLPAVAAHVRTGQAGPGEGGCAACLGGVEGIQGHTRGPDRIEEPGIGIGIVRGGPAAAARMAGAAGQAGRQVHVLRMGPGDAGEARAARALRQSARPDVAGEAGTGVGSRERGVGQLVTDFAERRRGGGGGSRVGMA